MLVYGSSSHARLNSPAIHTAPTSCRKLWLRSGAREHICQAEKLRGAVSSVTYLNHNEETPVPGHSKWSTDTPFEIASVTWTSYCHVKVLIPSSAEKSLHPNNIFGLLLLHVVFFYFCAHVTRQKEGTSRKNPRKFELAQVQEVNMREFPSWFQHQKKRSLPFILDLTASLPCLCSLSRALHSPECFFYSYIPEELVFLTELASYASLLCKKDKLSTKIHC